MFRASLCPSSGEQEQDWLKLHVKMPGCAGCGCVEPWCRPVMGKLFWEGAKEKRKKL
jgi:hypothetical protein